MFIQLLIATLLGICIGTLTGLIPGIHINLAATIIFSSLGVLNRYAPLYAIAALILSMSITHSFMDFIPAIFLGAPDEKTSLAVLPGHRLLLEGRGSLAIRLSIIGSFVSLIIIIALFPIFLKIISFFYFNLKKATLIILIAIIIFMIFKSEKRLPSILIFFLAGLLGIFVFDLNLSDPLLPMLSGLFGISFLIKSYFDKVNIPEQRKECCKDSLYIWDSLLASFLALLISLFPGLTTSHAALIASNIKKLDEKRFLVVIGGIGTANILLSLFTIYVFHKARNGAMVVFSDMIKMNFTTLLLFFSIALVAASLSVLLSLRIAGIFADIMPKINYQLINAAVIILVVLIAFFFTGLIGLLILAASSAIGFIAASYGIRKTHLMGCILLPVIIYLL